VTGVGTDGVFVIEIGTGEGQGGSGRVGVRGERRRKEERREEKGGRRRRGREG
jgi:hypothetical protein